MNRILLLSVLLAGCTGQSATDGATAARTPSAQPAASTASQAKSDRKVPMPATPVPQPAADACGARALQHLVGRPRSEIPVPAGPGRQRVACTTCPVTMDYSPERLNIFYNEKTGIIEKVSCG